MRPHSVRVIRVTVVAATLTAGSLAAQQPRPPVTAQDLRDGLKDPARWLNYSGDYGNHRHSPLTQITPENVQRLVTQWSFQTDTLGKFEAGRSSRTASSTSRGRSTPAGRSTRARAGRSGATGATSPAA